MDSSYSTPLLFILIGLLVWIIPTIRKYRKVLHGLQNKSGMRYWFRMLATGPSMFMPSIPYVSCGYEWPVRLKYKIFSSRGNDDIINFITWFPFIQPGYLIADPLAIQEVFSDRHRFQKLQEIYINVRVFGMNIISAEGDEWKRHRKALSPSLSERNNRMVWDESVKAMNGLIEKWGEDKESIDIPHIPDITVELALRVISAAGFGRSISWDDDANAIVTSGHKFTFQHALHIFATRLPLRLVIPAWMAYFSSFVREMYQADRELKLFMEEMVDERRQAKSEGVESERHDLFNAILASNEGNWDDVTDKFTNEEVFSNMFIFLLAGHETVAHSLAFVLGLLAIYPDEQEKLYIHIIETMNEKEPTYDQMNSFTYVMAVFFESMRLYPPLPVIPKQATEDTTIPMRRADGEIEHIPVANGSCLLLDVVAMHRNPKYWPDPEKFDPSRFMGQWNKDAYAPFSGGARGCIGRRFAEVEAVALLVTIIRHYRVELRDPDGKEYAHLSDMQKRDKLLRGESRMTYTPLNEPLVFKRRR